jgi:hypothetical protein
VVMGSDLDFHDFNRPCKNCGPDTPSRAQLLQ